MATSPKPGASGPDLFFQTANAYQQTAALRAAVELEVFTAIGEGNHSTTAIAKRCNASERGVRILCDYLVINGFLVKEDGQYKLTPDSGTFLDRRSPACVTQALRFLNDAGIVGGFNQLTEAVRRGASMMPEEGTTSVENPVWVEFARSMAPLQGIVAELLANLLNARAGQKWRVLDVAAGHGLFGIGIAKQNPNAQIVALDWPKVVEVAAENARKAGVAERHRTLAGSAFDVDFGGGYDMVLLTNFIHHFDPAAIRKFLKKVHAALAPGGQAVTVEFIPNEDRVTPPRAAGFALIMLATTAAGDAYTFSEYKSMFQDAGFSSVDCQAMPPAPQSVMLARK
jgi:2-polyprenyl-3-methyl-5-hydroxy-6-metoxy-1,4-benzoquinol methylase/predicted transcriptional regulator